MKQVETSLKRNTTYANPQSNDNLKGQLQVHKTTQVVAFIIH